MNKSLFGCAAGVAILTVGTLCAPTMADEKSPDLNQRNGGVTPSVVVETPHNTPDTVVETVVEPSGANLAQIGTGPNGASPADGGAAVDCECGGIYNVGDRVEALIDNPQGQADIVAGDQGSVVCGTSLFPGFILIEWDGLTSGHDGNGFCACPVGSATPGTGWYVLCDEIAAVGGGGEICTCPEPGYSEGDRVALTVDNPDGNPDLLAGDEGEVICGRFFTPDLMLVSWDDFASGHDGLGLCDCPTGAVAPGTSGWYVFCDEIEPAGTGGTLCVCAEPGYEEGDRVELLVDNPDGSPDLLAGDLGTVICGRFFAPDLMLVSWDDFTSGHDGFGACDCPTDGVAPGTSGWFVFCDEIAPAAAEICVCPDPGYVVGDRVVLLVDNPDGSPDLFAGDLGTMICGRFFAPDLVLVSWDDFTSGHDGFGACDCPVDGAAPGTSGWFVFCDEIDLFSGCVGDVDGDGDTDFTDLLFVLANFGCGL